MDIRTSEALQLMELIESLEIEDIIFLHGKIVIVRPASPNDVERLSKKSRGGQVHETGKAADTPAEDSD